MTSYCVTYSGIEFDPLKPDPKLIRVHDIAHHLSNICRFGGATSKHYSVAQHSLLVASLMPAETGALGQLVGLLHDAAEAYLTDMPTPIKRSTFLAGFVLLEQRLMQAIEEALVYPEGVTLSDIIPLIPVVKEADQTALLLEGRKFLPKAAWVEQASEGKVLPEVKLEAWPQVVAKNRFLDHYFDSVTALHLERAE